MLPQLNEASPAQPAELEAGGVSGPNLEHLLSLKVPALRRGQALRVLKDMTDVAKLLAVNGVVPRACWVRAYRVVLEEVALGVLVEKHRTIGLGWSCEDGWCH